MNLNHIDNSSRQIFDAETRHLDLPGPQDDAMKAYRAARLAYIKAEWAAENAESESEYQRLRRAEARAEKAADAALDALLEVMPLTGDDIHAIDQDVRECWRINRNHLRSLAAARGGEV